MKITRRPTVPTRLAAAEYFTGTVYQDPIVETEAPARLRSALVTFTPGARTNWHTHPLGQTLYVTAGTGRVQLEGQPIETIGAGDVVWISPGERHWHGAGPDTMVSHVAMHEHRDGSHIDWAEPVSDEDYAKA